MNSKEISVFPAFSAFWYDFLCPKSLLENGYQAVLHMPDGAFIDRNRQLKAVNDVWFVCLHCKDMFPNKKMTGNLCHRFLSIVSDYNCVFRQARYTYTKV